MVIRFVGGLCVFGILACVIAGLGAGVVEVGGGDYWMLTPQPATPTALIVYKDAAVIETPSVTPIPEEISGEGIVISPDGRAKVWAACASKVEGCPGVNLYSEPTLQSDPIGIIEDGKDFLVIDDSKVWGDKMGYHGGIIKVIIWANDGNTVEGYMDALYVSYVAP